VKAVGVIPARYSSVRFEGKVLADINGRPMIQRVWEAALRAKALDDLIVACDDERIMKAVKAFGGKAVMTARGHGSGTERITEVVADLDDAAYPLLHTEGLVCATLMKRIEHEEEIADPNVVKVVVGKKGNALYFSRCPVPFVRDDEPGMRVHYKHIGLYAYTKDFLFTYKKLSPTRLEELEKLEQLRILEHGFPIRVMETKHESIGVDTREDLERVCALLNIKNKAQGET